MRQDGVKLSLQASAARRTAKSPADEPTHRNRSRARIAGQSAFVKLGAPNQNEGPRPADHQTRQKGEKSQKIDAGEDALPSPCNSFRRRRAEINCDVAGSLPVGAAAALVNRTAAPAPTPSKGAAPASRQPCRPKRCGARARSSRARGTVGAHKNRNQRRSYGAFRHQIKIRLCITCFLSGCGRTPTAAPFRSCSVPWRPPSR